MKRKATMSLVLSVVTVLLLSSIVFAEGDNTPDPLVNLALLEDAVVSGSVDTSDAGGKDPMDILWDPSTNDWATVSDWHEYGQAFGLTQGGITKENPMWWKVEWPTEKNVNYITCTGVYGNQPQPTTGWAVQVLVDGNWQDLAKAHDGWMADTLRGVGVGVKTQTNWLWDGMFVWRGLEPVVTKGVRFTVYANPDSLADNTVSFADSVKSFSWTGRQLEAGGPKAALIQYLDFSEEEADNRKMDGKVNLALLDEAVVSASFVKSTYDNIRGEPAQICYDLIKDDYYDKNTAWGEFGYGFGYEVGYPDEGQYSDPPAVDDAFYWQVEWPVPKNINFFTWGGTYTNQPQHDTPWAVKYWDGTDWEYVTDGVGGSLWNLDAEGNFLNGDASADPPIPGDTLLPLVVGVDGDAFSTLKLETPITTTKLRLEVWSDGITPLWSFVIRCRGGACISVDDTENPFKAALVQYRDLTALAVEPNEEKVATEFALYQNYPNPFNPTTTIGFSLEKPSQVKLSVFNLIGQEIAVIVNEMTQSGYHQATFDSKSLSSGFYFYKLQVGQKVLTKKMLLLQ